MKMSKDLTTAHSLNKLARLVVTGLFGATLFIALTVVTGCGKKEAIPTPVPPPTEPVPPPLDPLPPPCLPGDPLCDPIDPDPIDPIDEASYTGYIYIASFSDGFESFLYVGGRSYYIGSQTSTSVRTILNSLMPGVYSIRFSGTMGSETGHMPNPSATYEVIHISRTF